MVRRSLFLLTATAILIASLLSSAVAQPAVAEPKPATSDQFKIPDTDDGLPGAGPIRRSDWFRGVWKKRRGSWADKKESDQGAVVFFGDSITQGWGEISNSFPDAPDFKTANRGISGDTTRGMLIRVKEDVIALNPNCVVMLMGTNDLAEKADPETIVGNVKLIIAELKNHNPDIEIILCNVFPCADTDHRPKSKIVKINELNAKAGSGDPKITVLDTYKLFADKNGFAKPDEFPDMLHPNEKGYAKWAAALRPLFETMGYIPVANDDFQLEEGFVSLFNGKDLTGWRVRPTTKGERKSAANWQKNNPQAPPWPFFETEKRYDGIKATDDGRYLARNGRLVVAIPPEGRKIQQLFTTREFSSDFELRLEFRASPDADSGVFIRGKQLQCRDFPVAGPYKELKNFKPYDWNELVVRVTGNVAHCSCNGEVIEAEFKVPASGPIGVEGDRGQMEYRRIRIKM